MLAELQLIRGVVDMIPAMLAYWSASQQCVFANRAYERWFGVSPDWLIGRTMKELLGPIYQLNLPFIEEALRGHPQSFEREIPDPKGGPPRYSQADYLPDIQDGVVRGFYVLVSDISQRKTMEDDLRFARNVAEEALSQVKTLKGLLPICAWCEKIRDEDGTWSALQRYISKHTDASFTHGLCEACLAKNYPLTDEGEA
jgi:PAS domain S-box-containing protein